MEKKIIGIIAEYNPFHNGHKYQITYAKKDLGAEYCVVAMSGNFVQRGVPAIIDKYSRAQMAIAEGADLVFEIPACFATGSLDDFALGAVSLVNSLGVVSHLLFGSETGKIEIISCISKAMTSDFKSYSIIRSAMKSGLSVANAMKTPLSHLQDKKLFQECTEAVSKPNNILGVLYMNALSYLNSNIVPVTHARIGQAYLDDCYHNMLSGNGFASATAIRKCIYSNKQNISIELSKYIPNKSFQSLVERLQERKPISEDDCWSLLCQKLQTNSSSLTDFRLVSPMIANAIAEGLNQSHSWEELVKYVSAIGVSPSKVNRCLTHILLGITERVVKEFLEDEICYYAKVLGVSTQGCILLERIRSTSTIPILCIKEPSGLSAIAKSQLNIDLIADRIYASL